MKNEQNKENRKPGDVMGGLLRSVIRAKRRSGHKLEPWEEKFLERGKDAEEQSRRDA